MTVPTRSPRYSFDTDRDAEETRLIAQARLLDPLTEAYLIEAGLEPGMRVLDLGSGAGDTALLAARLVGPEGSVLGVERSAESVALARRRVAATGLDNISFVEGDVAALDGLLAEHPEIDAVIGRLILMWVPDPVEVLRACARRLRPGALVFCVEADLYLEYAVPHSPLWDRVQYWVDQALAAAQAESRMGPHLHPAFRAAGLPAPQLRGRSILASAADAPTWFWVNIVRGILPVLVSHGIADTEQVDVASLEQRLQAELLSTDGVMSLPPFTVAWTRIPDRPVPGIDAAAHRQLR